MVRPFVECANHNVIEGGSCNSGATCSRARRSRSLSLLTRSSALLMSACKALAVLASENNPGRAMLSGPLRALKPSRMADSLVTRCYWPNLWVVCKIVGSYCPVGFKNEGFPQEWLETRDTLDRLARY